MRCMLPDSKESACSEHVDIGAICSFMAWNWYPAIKEGTDTAKSPPRLHAHADMDVRAQRAAHAGLALPCLAMSLQSRGLMHPADHTSSARTARSMAS